MISSGLTLISVAGNIKQLTVSSVKSRELRENKQFQLSIRFELIDIDHVSPIFWYKEELDNDNLL